LLRGLNIDGGPASCWDESRLVRCRATSAAIRSPCSSRMLIYRTTERGLDMTIVPTWDGMVYVAFVFDVFSRMIVGWRVSTSMTTDLVLDCFEMAIWARSKSGVDDLSGLVHHTDAGSQYTSFAFTDRLIEAGIDSSIGSVGDAYP